jgi:hypothetical protein
MNKEVEINLIRSIKQKNHSEFKKIISMIRPNNIGEKVKQKNHKKSL